MQTRILLVDDNREFAHVLARLLTRMAQALVTTCCDATEALSVARTLAPHLILLDYNMPGVRAEDLLQAFSPSCPVVLISGHITPQMRESCLHSGVVAFLEKPFDPAAFRKLGSILEAVSPGGAGALKEVRS